MEGYIWNLAISIGGRELERERDIYEKARERERERNYERKVNKVEKNGE